MSGESIKNLVGHTISNIQIDDDGRRMVITTRSHRFTFSAEGECCAVAYLIMPDSTDLQAVIDQEVVVVKSNGWKRTHDSDWGDVVDTGFYSIQTHNGDLDLELRVSHNGYYGGWLKLISKEECWPVFDDIREEAQASM